MSEISVCLKPYIDEEGFKIIEELKNACTDEQDIYLKLELDFKLDVAKAQEGKVSDNANEFFYYIDSKLAGYLGIFSFGGEEAELTGMVHPMFRRRGIFKRLYALALEECKRRDFKRILLVCDNKSSSGLEFIKAAGAEYSFSEYEMKFSGNYINKVEQIINLRKASNKDSEEITRQNSIYFGDEIRTLIMPEEEEKSKRITYIVELDKKVIGKIKVDTSTNEGYISAFGILPEYRGKGYGRQALNAALNVLKDNNILRAALAVAAQNKNALSLYKSCGFAEESVMDYYEVKLI